MHLLRIFCYRSALLLTLTDTKRSNGKQLLRFGSVIHIGDSHQRTAMWLPNSHLWFTPAQERWDQSSSHSVPSPEYLLSITRDLLWHPHHPTPIFPLATTVPLWPWHSHAFELNPECNCISNKLFSEFYSQPPFSPPVHFIWGCGSKHPDRIIATHLFYTLCRLSPQRDAFLIGFLNADNQTANNKLPPHPSFLLLLIFFPQGKAAAELWCLTASYSKKQFIWQTIENTQHSNC